MIELLFPVISIQSEKLPVPQKVIAPAINPLSPKNMELSQQDITKYRKKYKILDDKPIMTQISRFDYLKGSIRSY